MNAAVGIDPDRRAYHMFILSGFTDDQINHMYGYVCDPDVEGPSATLGPRKIQEAVLRFYDKPWDVDRHRDSRASMGRYSRPLIRRSPGKKKPSQLKMATSTTTGADRSPRGNSTQPRSTTTGKRKLTRNLPGWRV